MYAICLKLLITVLLNLITIVVIKIFTHKAIKYKLRLNSNFCKDRVKGVICNRSNH